MPERSDLAEFLRAKREALTPAEVGLRDSGRRRTPGLRREEVAALAGVSIDYLVRLEQGRDTNPSSSVLAAIAEALHLAPEDRQHLVHLAAIGNHREFCPTTLTPDADVPPTVQALIDQIDPTPAFVLGPYGDVLAWNAAWEHAVGPLGLLDATTDRNLARFVFEHAAAATVFPDWSASADEQVSVLRTASVRWREDPRFEQLLADLLALPEFASRWSTHEVGEKRRGVKRLVHPAAGELRIAYESLILPGDQQRLITWLAADEATAVALRRVTGEEVPTAPANLRVVGHG